MTEEKIDKIIDLIKNLEEHDEIKIRKDKDRIVVLLTKKYKTVI